MFSSKIGIQNATGKTISLKEALPNFDSRRWAIGPMRLADWHKQMQKKSVIGVSKNGLVKAKFLGNGKCTEISLSKKLITAEVTEIETQIQDACNDAHLKMNEYIEKEKRRVDPMWLSSLEPDLKEIDMLINSNLKTTTLEEAAEKMKREIKEQKDLERERMRIEKEEKEKVLAQKRFELLGFVEEEPKFDGEEENEGGFNNKSGRENKMKGAFNKFEQNRKKIREKIEKENKKEIDIDLLLKEKKNQLKSLKNSIQSAAINAALPDIITSTTSSTTSSTTNFPKFSNTLTYAVDSHVEKLLRKENKKNDQYDNEYYENEYNEDTYSTTTDTESK